MKTGRPPKQFRLASSESVLSLACKRVLIFNLFTTSVGLTYVYTRLINLTTFDQSDIFHYLQAE